MSLTNCVECKAECSESALSCPSCGRILPSSSDWERYKLLLILIVILIFIISPKEIRGYEFGILYVVGIIGLIIWCGSEMFSAFNELNKPFTKYLTPFSNVCSVVGFFYSIFNIAPTVGFWFYKVLYVIAFTLAVKFVSNYLLILIIFIIGWILFYQVRDFFIIWYEHDFYSALKFLTDLFKN